MYRSLLFAAAASSILKKNIFSCSFLVCIDVVDIWEDSVVTNNREGVCGGGVCVGIVVVEIREKYHVKDCIRSDFST